MQRVTLSAADVRMDRDADPRIPVETGPGDNRQVQIAGHTAQAG
jgi:hypothetical protein